MGEIFLHIYQHTRVIYGKCKTILLVLKSYDNIKDKQSIEILPVNIVSNQNR